MDIFGSRDELMVSPLSRRPARVCDQPDRASPSFLSPSPPVSSSPIPLLVGFASTRNALTADVINVSGHRLSTAEVESALILHKGVAETAVVGCADDVTGQAVHAFVCMKPEYDSKSTDDPELAKELTLQVRKVIGPFAAPKKIVSPVLLVPSREINRLSLLCLLSRFFLSSAKQKRHVPLPSCRFLCRKIRTVTDLQYIVTDLPKTRSGKIMRRVLRKIVSGEGDQLGDMSSLANPDSVEESESSSLFLHQCCLGLADGVVKTKATPK